MTGTETINGAGGGEPVTILYTNWRGETAVRRLDLSCLGDVGAAAGRLWLGSTQWHPDRQYLLTALDADKGEWRDFALSGIKAWGQEAVDAALAAPAAKGKTIPAGWVLVPEEATGAMWQVGLEADAHHRDSYSAIYQAMIEAAPLPPAGDAGSEQRRDDIACHCAGSHGPNPECGACGGSGCVSGPVGQEPAGDDGGGESDLAALSAGATQTKPYDPVRGWMAEGCCSACSPCSHQKRDPYSICDVCQKAAAIGAERTRLNEHQRSVAKAAAERAAKNAKVAPELLFAPILWAIQEAPAPEIRTQGDPVAWAYEWLDDRDSWCPAFSEYLPDPAGHNDLRHIRPLYEAPAAPRSASPVTVEDIDAVLVHHLRITLTKDERDDIRNDLLALLQAPRPGGETGDGR